MTTCTTSQVIGIGLDVSKHKLDLALKLSDQKYLAESFSNDDRGITALCTFLKQQEAAKAAPLVIESTGDYHLQSALMIKQKKYNVKLINPIITKCYQKSSIRNAKTDKIDASRLADIAVLENNLPDFNSNVVQVRARKLVSLLAHLEKSKQQITASLNHFESTAKVIGLKYSLTHLKKALKALNAQIKNIKKVLADSMPEQIKKQAEEIKGVTLEKLAIIHTLTADKTFSNRNQFVAFFGLDIAVRKSGQWVGKSKLSKRGNSYARKILYQMAWGLKTHNDIFKTSYDKYRDGKCHYNAVLVILARKFLRFYFSLNLQYRNNEQVI
jgi:transposase